MITLIFLLVRAIQAVLITAPIFAPMYLGAAAEPFMNGTHFVLWVWAVLSFLGLLIMTGETREFTQAQAGIKILKTPKPVRMFRWGFAFVFTIAASTTLAAFGSEWLALLFIINFLLSAVYSHSSIAAVDSYLEGN